MSIKEYFETNGYVFVSNVSTQQQEVDSMVKEGILIPVKEGWFPSRSTAGFYVGSYVTGKHNMPASLYKLVYSEPEYTVGEYIHVDGVCHGQNIVLLGQISNLSIGKNIEILINNSPVYLPKEKICKITL